MTVDPTLPGPTLGVVGGGQLGRMLAEAAAPLGVDVIVLDPTDPCPAARSASDQIVADFDDAEAIARLAERSDILTLEIELADPHALEAVDTPVEPAPATLATIQDKLDQMEHLEQAGVPLPPFRRVDTKADLERALDELGSPVMLKARTGGYDGRGNMPVHAEYDLEAALEAVGGSAMAEAFIEFERELAVMAARGSGETMLHPVTETVHRDEILRETIVPPAADASVIAKAESVARTALEALEGRGIFGIELFETVDGEVLLNEVAPRPHNSGHWTIEGAVTSQFEQHIRAVLGWPLGPTDRIHETVVSVNVLGDGTTARSAQLTGLDRILASPRSHLHWYGKVQTRPLRKMGHLTVTSDSDDIDLVRSRGNTLRGHLEFAE